MLNKSAATGLYLELMKRSLMNLIYGGDSDMDMRKAQYRDTDTGGKQFVTGASVDPDLQRKGQIWPSMAHTMIGRHRLDNIQFCVEQVLDEDIPGDLIETGVWRGGATIFMRALLAAYEVSDRKVWVADSFEGLPSTKASLYTQDANLDWLSKVDILAVTEETVRDNFSRYDLLDRQVSFLKGWFRDTLPNAPIDKLAILRLDGDLYESTMDALVNLYPKLSVGGYLIVDDYFVPACRAAIHDYRGEHGITDQIIPIDDWSIYWRHTE